jgi:hypothetical protein
MADEERREIHVAVNTETEVVSDEERTGNCVICTHRDAREGWVCDPCRGRLAGQLRDIPQLVEELRGEVPSDFYQGEERIEEKADHLVDLDGELAAVVRVERLHVLGVNAGAIAGQSNAPRVQGSREAPVPISVDRTDLLSAARVLNLTKTYDKDTDQWRVPYPEDQIGHQPAAAILDGWCRDFAETRRESAPEPTPAKQCRYLGDRLDWAFTDHAAVDEFAGEVSDLWHVLRRACGLTDPRPELVEGVPCKSVDCDLKTLMRIPVSVYQQAEFIECSSCSRLYSLEEFDEWVRLVRAPLCGKRNGEWWCALAKKHDGVCGPYKGEEGTE